MRTTATPSEFGKLLGPLARLFDGAWQRMHWWVLAMAVIYAGSGITVVRPDEVAIVLRWGRLLGDVPAVQEHGPGLLFAFPRPVDEVVRVKTKHVSELRITTLADRESFWGRGDTLDPVKVGYALTGDQNIVQVDMTARFQLREPAEAVFYGPTADDILRVEVSAAMLRSLGEIGVDHVLSDRRRDLIATATRRAQAGLDAAHSGLALVSLELTSLAPPRALALDFDAVQSAYIGAETQRKEAQGYAQDLIPRSHAEANSAVQSAHADAAAALARAQGESAAFLALETEYRKKPALVCERLYRDAVDKAIGCAQAVRWIPPPIGVRYEGLRLMINPDDAGAQATSPTGNEDKPRTPPRAAVRESQED